MHKACRVIIFSTASIRLTIIAIPATWHGCKFQNPKIEYPKTYINMKDK